MNKFNNIAIYTSNKNESVKAIVLQTKEILENLNSRVFLSRSSSLTLPKEIKDFSDNYVVKKADLVISVGGDGTMLSCARKFGSKGLPMLGINLGNIGFLADIPPEDLTASLKEILKGKYTSDKRSFIQTKLNNEKKHHVALNEAVIHSGAVAQMIEYELLINDVFIYRQRADGLIIASSTGSTGYSLSGNGPIMDPKLRALILLPMFPHSLNARPLIVNEEASITVKIKSNRSAKLSLDSHNYLNLKKDDEIMISSTPYQLNLIHPVNHDFYDACRTKLGWSLGF